MSVAVRELKASLSRVLSRAQNGEIIEVTSHNKPIARIIGIPEHAEPGLRGFSNLQKYTSYTVTCRNGPVRLFHVESKKGKNAITRFVTRCFQ